MKPSVGLTVAVVIVAAVGAVVYLKVRRADPEDLLRRAYEESRPFAARWPGADHTPMRQVRSATSGAASAIGTIDRPRALLEAEAALGQPDLSTVTGLRRKSGLDLLSGRWDDAVVALERARDQDPENEAVWLELANAYLTRGDRTERPLDYALAMDWYARLLDKQPKSAEALFNLAYTFERFHLWLDARDAWARYQKEDTGSNGWAAEARERQQFAELMIEGRQKMRARITKDPAAYVAMRDEDSDSDVQLNVALEEWLPLRGSQPEARAALDKLARLQKARHQDGWLAAYLSTSRDVELDSAVRAMVKASRLGDGGAGGEASARALQLAARTGNRAALVRARVEEAYAFQWKRDVANCTNAADAAIRDAERAGYQWIYWQARMQKTICAAIGGQRSKSVEESAGGSEGVQKSGYKSLAYRWAGLDLARRRASGSVLSTWRSGLDGMAEFWRAPYENFRLVQYPYELSRAATELSLAHTGYFLQRAAAQGYVDTGRDRLEAGQRTQLAVAALRLGNVSEYERQSKRAEELLERLDEDAAVRSIRAYARVTRAEAELRAGRASKALGELDSWQPEASLEFDYWRMRGEAEAASGAWDKARTSLERAAADHQRQMSARLAPADRFEAHNRALPVHRLLLDTLWRLGKAKDGVAQWEAFQGEMVNSHRKGIASEMRAATLVAWVMHGDQVYSWIGDDRGSRERRLTVKATQLRRAIRDLARGCADRRTPVGVLESHAQVIRQSLVDPWRAHLEPGRVLVIEAEGDLAGIPWAFVLGPDTPLVMMDGLEHWRSDSDEGVTARSEALVLAAPKLPAELRTMFPPLEAAHDEGIEVARRFERSRLYEGKDATFANLAKEAATAEVFHFAGHGFLNAGNGGLMLAPGEALEARRLRSVAWPRCRLAVLSGCTTGAGEQQGAVNPESLARALLDAGVRRVIASRWAVDSQSTRELFKAFYGKAAGGDSPSRALAKASADIRRRADYAHPYYWAGFQLYGQP